MAIKSSLERRSFAIGDVHGCSRTLQKMVEEVLQLKPGDTLYLLGDYIDRGPDSKGVLDYLMHLTDSGYDIRPIMGNHEEMLLNAVINPVARNLWYGNGGWATLQEFGVGSPEKISQRYIDFLTDFPYTIVTKDFVFVHAGLDFRTQNPLIDTPTEFMLWARDCQADSVKLGGRTLVTGHSVTPLFTIKDSLGTDHIILDNGCYDRGEMCCGSLVALNLDSRELLVQNNVESRTVL